MTTRVLFDADRKSTRQCGDCTLCCKLVPTQVRPAQQDDRIIEGLLAQGLAHADEFNPGVMPGFDKPAGQRCPHQRHGKGCAVYATRPMCCRFWNCRWLVNEDTADLSRPDRSHVVLDIIPDYISLVDNATGGQRDIEVVQVWVDPNFPDAWRAPTLLAYLERRGREGIAALIRYSSSDAFTVFPPSMSSDGQWHEVRNGVAMPERTPEEFLNLMAGRDLE